MISILKFPPLGRMDYIQDEMGNQKKKGGSMNGWLEVFAKAGLGCNV